ncbi:DUF2199 domain-containing protein [Duganella sp. HH105]|uniref:DUF2199 domain-containing protein n=1 Tax=Duganella sp. HH105 TaxID=1781067 RepID=UPI000892CACC|nr:DUF2199 domain-containing protein [Duganella sp. HH105]OEZ49437.1 hypothetical protein DUGA6_62910 [Duganella sp. HH105]
MSDPIACSECGELHTLDEVELVFRRPDAIVALSDAEREARCRESEDLCAIWGDSDDSHRYFVRGLLPLTVIGRPLDYRLGVWMEVRRDVFDRIYALWDSDTQLDEPPLDGLLANDVPTRPGSLGLHGKIHLTGPETRPEFMVADAAAALFADQRDGMSAHQAAAFVRSLDRRSA